MLAIINGLTVSGSPEEIQRFSELNLRSNQTTNINVHINNPSKSPQQITEEICKHIFKSAGVKLMP